MLELVLVVLEEVLVVLELELVLIVVLDEDEVEVVELEVEVVVKSKPLQFAPSYLIQQSVSVSWNSSPGCGLVGVALCSYTFPISFENVVVILTIL